MVVAVEVGAEVDEGVGAEVAVREGAARDVAGADVVAAPAMPPAPVPNENEVVPGRDVAT